MIAFDCPGPGMPLFEEAKALGDSEARFLGLLPHAAWADYAQRGQILVAVDPNPRGPNGQGKLAGYVAFRLPRQEVAVAHLVIHPDFRGRGIARLLVEELRHRYPERRGLALNCRRDFPASKMWPVLGFVSTGERPGRGQGGLPLTRWWLDNGHPDLLTWNGPSDSLLSIVIDTNVFIDIHAGADGEISDRTREVLDSLGDRIEVLVSPELLNEIERIDDAEKRRSLRGAAQAYSRLVAPPDEIRRLEGEIVSALSKKPGRIQDRSDILHIAHAAAVGVRVVVTRDRPALNKLAEIVGDKCGVLLTTPSNVVALVDELENESAYAPVVFMRTDYQLNEIDSGSVQMLRGFLSTGTGEKLAAFERETEFLAAAKPRSRRVVCLSPTGEPIALVGLDYSGSTINVRLARMCRTPIAISLAAQMTEYVRQVAASLNCSLVKVTDSHLHSTLRDAFIADGYAVGNSSELLGLVLPTVAPRTEAVDAISEVLAAAGEAERLVLRSLVQEESFHTPSGAMRAEHVLRPFRLTDAPLPTWLIPIKPQFAADLFGWPEQLFNRPSSLGMSREHVYYKARSAGESAPGRTLWYVSGYGHQQIIACSGLVDVVDGEPDVLYRRFQRLGVYTRSQVRATAGSRQRVRALHVTDTEIFPYPVTLSRLKRLGHQHGQNVQLVSSTRMIAGLAGELLREGRLGGV